MKLIIVDSISSAMTKNQYQALCGNLSVQIIKKAGRSNNELLKELKKIIEYTVKIADQVIVFMPSLKFKAEDFKKISKAIFIIFTENMIYQQDSNFLLVNKNIWSNFLKEHRIENLDANCLQELDSKLYLNDIFDGNNLTGNYYTKLIPIIRELDSKKLKLTLDRFKAQKIKDILNFIPELS